MPKKSHVSIERKKCPICGLEFETNSILLDNRVRPIFNRYTTTGWGLCPEHKRLYEEGYVALVGCDEAKSRRNTNGSVKMEDAYRTGRIMHIRREVARKVFNVPFPDDLPMMFCDDAVIDKFENKGEEDEKN